MKIDDTLNSESSFKFVLLDIIKHTHIKSIQQHNLDGMKIVMTQCNAKSPSNAIES